MPQRKRRKRSLVFYHRTTPERAERILVEDFRDGEGYNVTSRLRKGVWLSNNKLHDENEGACGDIMIKVSLDMNASELDRYEWVEEGKPYREWLVPARVINPRMRLDIVDEHGRLGPPPSRWVNPRFSPESSGTFAGSRRLRGPDKRGLDSTKKRS
jgi:hypothetical protein